MAKRMTKQTPRKRAPTPAATRTGKWKVKFLKELGETGNVTLACRAANVGRNAAYECKAREKSFASAWDQALETAVELMEAEMHRRAFKGTEKPQFYEGEEVGVIREYSDTLAIFLAKAHRPEKYRDRFTVKDETPGRSAVDPVAAVAAVARFLGQVESESAAAGPSAGGEAGGAGGHAGPVPN